MAKAKKVITKKKPSRVNIVAIIGSYPWAMDQIILGRTVKRAGWKDKTVDMISMDNFHPTATDKKRHDWQIVQPIFTPTPVALPIDAPDYATYAAGEDTEHPKGLGWTSWFFMAVGVAVIIAALYGMNSVSH